jgi:hypothetical protein
MPRRARIEASARQAFPGLRYRRCQTRQGPIHTYELVLEVPGYESRRVWVEFVPPLSNSPRIYADGPSGPEASPHRFSERRWTRLCVWYPGDPLERRWVPDDGLLMLFGMIATHLLKEAWWRESGEWLGEEAPHGVRTEEDDFTAKDIA